MRRRTPLLALLVAQALLVGIPLVRGSWFADDVFNAAVVHGKPLDWNFMSRDFFGHFLPLAQVPLWVAGHLVLHHTTVMMVELVGVLLCTVLLVTVLQELVGDRPALVYGVALVYVTTPMTLPSILWWASAFEQVPAHVSVLLAVLLHLKWLRTRRSWLLVALAAVVGAGICFWDLVNLVIVWLPALTLALPSPSTRDRIRRLAGAWPAWVAVIVPLLLYQWGYSMAKHGSPTSPGLSLFGRFVGTAWFRGFVPGLTGGPIVWRYSGYGFFAVSNTPLWLMVLSQAAVLTFVISTVRRSVASLWAWLLVVCAVLPPLALVALGRLGLLGPDIGRDFRYLSLTAVAALLGVALAIDSAWPATNPAGHNRPELAGRRQRAVGLGATAVVVALSLVSAIRYDAAWDKLPVDRYFATIAADANRLNTDAHPITVVDQNVPPAVQVDYFGPGTARMSWVLPPLGLGGIRFDGAADTPYWIDKDGHINPANLETSAQLPPAMRSCTLGKGMEMLRFTTSQQLPWVGDYVLALHLKGGSASKIAVRMLKEGKPIPTSYYDSKTYTVTEGSHLVVLTQNGTPFNGADVIVNSAKPVCVDSARIARIATTG